MRRCWAERSRATAARGWPTARQPAGVGDLQLGQCQRYPQALGAAPGGLERRSGRGRVPGRGGQVAAQPGSVHQG